MQLKDLDRNLIKVKAANKDFATLTIEIGNSNSALGNSSTARKLIANEYKNYNFDKLLTDMPKMMD